LGKEFLPYLQPVMENLLKSITQDVSAGTGGIDLDNLEELEERSDVELIETEDGWLAVRTAAVEEQASACQLVVLLVEKLQEHFYPFVEPTIRAIAPLLQSPHEDVRSYCMLALPEFVRSTGKATIPDRSALVAISEYTLGLLVTTVEKEGTLELIMTALQALKLVLNYTAMDWSAWAARAAVRTRASSASTSQKTAAAIAAAAAAGSPNNLVAGTSSGSGGSSGNGGGGGGGIGAALAAAAVASTTDTVTSGPKGMEEPPAPTPDRSIRFLNSAQMIAITQCAKVGR
jgi:hypothetical protein